MSITALDHHNARLYAMHRITIRKYQSYRKSHPHVFSEVEFSVRQATHEDFYVPKKIANECKVATIKFNEKGCRKVGCYPFDKDNAPCRRSNRTVVSQYGNGFTFACQPACYELLDGRLSEIDTVFFGGRCLLANHLVKQYAINPQSRADYSPEFPFHLGLDVRVNPITATERLALNDWYCEAHGLVLDGRGDCVASSAQKAGELFVGSTIYRSLNLLINRHPPRIPPPAIPDDISSGVRWRNDAGGQAKPPAPQALKRTRMDVPDDSDEFSTGDLVREIARDVAFDVGVDVSANRLSRFLRKTVPKKILKTISQTALSAIAGANRYHVMMAAASASRIAGIALKSANAAMFIFQAATLILDVVDPCQFNEVLDRVKVDRITSVLQSTFVDWIQSMGFENRELTPEALWQYMESNVEVGYDEELLVFAEERVREYIDALDVNSYGQRLKVQNSNYQRLLLEREKRKRRGRTRDSLLYHFLVTSLFFILGISFLHQLHLVVFGYALFVFFFNELVLNDFEAIKEAAMILLDR